MLTEHSEEAELVEAAVNRVRMHRMDPWGLHGLAHWWRVRHNGLLIADVMNANRRVLLLFAIFHDSHRMDDEFDPDHGPRAAAWLSKLRRNRRDEDASRDDSTVAAAIRALADPEFQSLHDACAFHTHEPFHDDPTVAACFVADRLDLSRAGFRPDPARMPGPSNLLTDAFIDEAIARQRAGLDWNGGRGIERTWKVRPARWSSP